MQTGYYAAAGGMVAQFNRLDTIANNLANVNTSGYKKEGLITGDFMRLYKEARDELPLENQTIEGAQFFNRAMVRVPHIVESYTDQSMGQFQQTGNSLDFALQREGLFFAVETPAGIRLTRDGSFTLDENGQLVTKQGYKVLSSDYKQNTQGAVFSTEESKIETDRNGQISVLLPGTTQMAQKMKLLVVQPENINRLQKVGDNLYMADSADALMPLEESGAVVQGAVEKSNVNAVNEMVAMIEANRMVGMYQKAMDTQMNDMNRDAIEKLAVTRR